MIEHNIDHEYEIFVFVDHFGSKMKDILGNVFARDSREAVKTAREQFGHGLGRLKAKEIE